MAVRLSSSGTLILVPPKVGGTWLRLALTAAGVTWTEEGPPEWGGQGGLDVHIRDGAFIATFVRGPVDWYRSYWAYRMEGGWRPRYELDRICSADDFSMFIRKTVIELPGFLNAMFERYAGPADDPIDFIGRQERLADDLVTLLERRNEKFVEAALRSVPRANTTSLRPAIDASLVDAICVSEQEMTQRFGYAWSDPIGMTVVQQRYPSDAETLRQLVLWTERTHWEPDDRKREAGDTSIDFVRQARCYGNYALFAQFVKGDVPYARSCYEAALHRAPKHPRTLANFAVLHADELDDPDNAERLFRRALDSRPNHIHSLRLFTLFLEQQGRSGEAAGYLERLCGLSAEEHGLRRAALSLFEEH